MVLILTYRKFFLIACLGLMAGSVMAELPDKLNKKLDKIIIKDLKLSDVNMTSVIISDSDLEHAEIEIKKDQLFKIVSADQPHGFLFIEDAMGRFHDFKYCIFINEDLSVKLVRVLEYNEEFGVEITNKRWLKQFIDRSPQNPVTFGKNIDGISGATISGSSITKSINEVLQKVKKLRENQLI